MMKRAGTILLVIAVAELSVLVARGQRADLLVEDFEGTNYGAWSVTGTAFGPAPAHGTLPNQMPVDGFHGEGLVNSYYGGDVSTGTLTSPPFKIERRYLRFLIGGGGWEGKTCMNLLVDGEVVRAATGPNIESGGSERLQPAQWDVSEFLGKEAVLQIVDNATGTWGHINVDEIVQSDKRSDGPVMCFNVTRSMDIQKPYLNLPVKIGAPLRRVSLLVNGRTERAFDIELADGKPDWWAFLDTAPFLGKRITLQVNELPGNSSGFNSVEQSAEIKDSQGLYRERLRPQFHFTTRRGWVNDPNGLVFYRGEYHLFYQYNPYGWISRHMHWGHAVSRDLVHWKELPVALYADEHGDVWSGSAVVDWNNTSGFQTGKEPALVAMFTAAKNPFSQHIAFSNDRGRTWTRYENNPVLGHIAAENRDPKMVWFAPEKKWVVALYLDHNDFALFSSPDLKSWQKLSDVHVPGDTECPNFFQVPLDGDKNNPRWVFFGASGVYLVGNFDGKTFTAETQPQRLHHGNCWYAAQVYSDIPASDGRCILVPWGRLPDGEIFRGMPFNQMMGLPVELRLKSTSRGPTLAVNPVKELNSLRQHTYNLKPQALTPGANPLSGIAGQLLEIEAVVALGEARSISLELRGVPVDYDVGKQSVSCMGEEGLLVPEEGRITLHIFVDRASIDIYGGGGTLYMPMAKALAAENQTLKLSCQGGNASIVSLKVHLLKSAW